MTKKSEKDKSGLTAAAEAVGSAAGKIAALVGIKEEPAPAKIVRKAKLEPKHRHRLPRRQKKAQRKASVVAAAPKRSGGERA